MSDYSVSKYQTEAILDLLDEERRNLVYPGTRRVATSNLVRHISEDGESCEIAFSSCSDEELDGVIEGEIRLARSSGYELEWKVYGHDRPPSLAQRLEARGFQAGERESFMVLQASEEALERFETLTCEIRQVTTRAELADVQAISEEVYGKSFAKQIQRYATMLENYPDSMSIYVAHVKGEPAACGRIYFHMGSRFAGIFGGQTREQFRRQGLFTQLVAIRLREALSRGVSYICVDALPTSEPILKKRGLESLTYTQPYVLVP